MAEDWTTASNLHPKKPSKHVDHFLYFLHMWEKETDLPLMISTHRLCHLKNKWISFESLPLFPVCVTVVFDGNLGLD